MPAAAPAIVPRTAPIGPKMPPARSPATAPSNPAVTSLPTAPPISSPIGPAARVPPIRIAAPTPFPNLAKFLELNILLLDATLAVVVAAISLVNNA